MTAKVAHIGDSQTDQLQAVAAAVSGSEGVSDVERLLGHLVSDELGGHTKVRRQRTGDFTGRVSNIKATTYDHVAFSILSERKFGFAAVRASRSKPTLPSVTSQP